MHHLEQPLHLTTSSFELQLIGLSPLHRFSFCKNMCDGAGASAASVVGVELLLCARSRHSNIFAVFDFSVLFISERQMITSENSQKRCLAVRSLTVCVEHFTMSLSETGCELFRHIVIRLHLYMLVPAWKGFRCSFRSTASSPQGPSAIPQYVGRNALRSTGTGAHCSP
jgi:hypothetical protein